MPLGRAFDYLKKIPRGFARREGFSRLELIDALLKYAEDENNLLAALKKLGFGNDFVQWIKTIFKKSQSCVMNNGTSTGCFNLERRSLTSSLFILRGENEY